MTVTETPGTVNVPTYSISEAAKFFGKSVPWLRWRQNQTTLFVKEDGSPIEIHRTVARKAKIGYRRYTLDNISDIADALHRAGKLSAPEYRDIQKKVEAFRA